MADVNILHNPALEDDFRPFRGDKKMQTPAGWGPWWVPPDDSPSAPTWQNHVPTFDSRYVDGRMVVHIHSSYATHTAGVWQQVPAVAGERYEFSADGMAWSSESAEAGVIESGTDVNLQVGVDPTGGLDADSPIIEWSAPGQPLAVWETLRLTITAQSSVVTVFLKSAPYLPKRQQSIFWRDAYLRPVGRYKRATNIVGPGDTHIQLEPERPQPETTAAITVSSQRRQKHTELRVYLPDGEPADLQSLGYEQTDDRHTWRYEFEVGDEGLYDVRFVGDAGARLLAQRLVRVARQVQIVPSGEPRLDYRRVYVLLPPTADENWFLAAARGGFAGRYTIGFSADDGGVGDVQDRHVIAVNPHHWPETLTATWYQQHYPGTKFTPLVANAPLDLETWLRDWMYE